MMENNYLIRLFRKNDVDDFLSLVNDNRDRLYLYFPITMKFVTDKKGSQKYINSKIESAKKNQQFAFLIEDKNNNKLIGYIIAKNFNHQKKECELAYWISKNEEGKGIISFAVRELVSFCFERLKLHSIYLRIDPQNPSSIRVAEKNNFTLEHIAPNDYERGDGQRIDVGYWYLKK